MNESYKKFEPNKGSLTNHPQSSPEMNTVEAGDRVSEDLHSPFGIVTAEKFSAYSCKEGNVRNPEQVEMMQRALQYIEREAVKNFSIFESTLYPRVAFSNTTLTISPETVTEILGAVSDQPLRKADSDHVESVSIPEVEHVEPKRITYALFTAFGLPPDGHAFTVQDVAIDRFMRLLPQVAGAMGRGENPPEITIHMLGAPTGYGGNVTPGWLNALDEEGIDAHGSLYAEFLNAELPNTGDVRTVLQGVSKGAVVANATYLHLSEDIRNGLDDSHAAQLLLDNPSGDHATGRGEDSRRILIGWCKEVFTLLFLNKESSLKGIMKHQKSFLNYLEQQTGVPQDELFSEQHLKKLQATWKELNILLDGVPVDEEVRTFIRRSAYDPLSVSKEKLQEILRKVEESEEGTVVRYGGYGKVSETPVVHDPAQMHFFFYENFRRWAEILSHLKRIENTE